MYHMVKYYPAVKMEPRHEQTQNNYNEQNGPGWRLAHTEKFYLCTSLENKAIYADEMQLLLGDDGMGWVGTFQRRNDETLGDPG